MIGERLEERVYQLEQYVAELQSEVSAANLAEPLGSGGHGDVRLAEVTTTQTGPSDNTFGIVFLDGRYQQTAGVQMPTWKQRQTTARDVAFNLGGVVIPTGTRLPVWRWNGRWWANWQSGSSTPPPTSAIRWQRCTKKGKFYYTTNATAPASIPLYGGNPEDNIALIEWWTKGGTTPGSTDRFGLGNADLLREALGDDDVIGYDDALTGNMIFTETGTYLVTLNVYFFRYRKSLGATFPSTPRTMLMSMELRTGDGTLGSVSAKQMGNHPVMTDATQFGADFGGDFGNVASATIVTGYLDGASGANDRFTASVQLFNPATDLGVLIQAADLLVVKL